MNTYLVNVLRGSETGTVYVVEVTACSAGSAFYKCRKLGYTPLQMAGAMRPGQRDGTVDIPVAEIDGTGEFSLAMKMDPKPVV